jgi:hypothetical protein
MIPVMILNFMLAHPIFKFKYSFGVFIFLNRFHKRAQQIINNLQEVQRSIEEEIANVIL